MAEERDASFKFSRRGFLKGMGGGLLGAGALAGGLLQDEAGAAESATLKGRQQISLKVNGRNQPVEVEPRTTLLGALRERLGLTGTKEVCDRGQCGACTVLVDGRAVLACMLLAVDARGREITTVEGLAPEGELTPVQRAFAEQDALMCGFCTPGLVVAAEALLRSNPDPSAEQIKQGVSGNLCRCGTYPKVFAAIAEAARLRRG